jgi:hypothetical protein
MTGAALRDLVVLVADKDMEQATRALLQRPASLGISAPTHDIYTHPARDNGCRTASHELLRPLASQCRYALVIFDREGSGGDALDREDLERQVEKQLAANGWANRCAALVLDPELEIWMWADSPELDQVIGWAGRRPPVREWLRTRGFMLTAEGKPGRPKEALHEALRHVRKQPSASLFAALAARAGLSRCIDPAFLKFKATLQRWFPPGPAGLHPPPR